MLVDFWTYTCINCIRTLPFLKGLYATYHPYGLEIVGVETPEFTFEQQAGNVLEAIRSDGLRYPVVQDNDYGTWNAYSNQYWPAEYLIDARGQVRHTHFGEGDYRQSEAAVRELLYRPGSGSCRAGPAPTRSSHPPTWPRPRPIWTTSVRRALPSPRPRAPGFYRGVGHPALNEFALRGHLGRHRPNRPPRCSRGRRSRPGFQAQHVYLVLTSAGNRPRRVRVLLDGRPIAAADAGADVHHGSVTVTGQRLYSLVSLPATSSTRSPSRSHPASAPTTSPSARRPSAGPVDRRGRPAGLRAN